MLGFFQWKPFVCLPEIYKDLTQLQNNLWICDIFKERNYKCNNWKCKAIVFDVEEKKQNKRDTKIFTSSFVLIFNTNGNIVPEVKT